LNISSHCAQHQIIVLSAELNNGVTSKTSVFLFLFSVWCIH